MEKERDKISEQVSELVTEFVPRIIEQLIKRQQHFDQWETDNKGPELCGNPADIKSEKTAREQIKSLSNRLLDGITEIKNYSGYFYPIEDPSDMIENPYPGFLSTERALNYCKAVLDALS